MRKKLLTVLLAAVLLLGIPGSAFATEWSDVYNLSKSGAPAIQAGDTLLVGCGFHGIVYVTGDYKCSGWADWNVSWGRAHQVALVNSISFNGSTVRLDITFYSNDGYPDDRHVAGEITYTWEGDQCTAKTMCVRTPTHEIKETVTGTYVKDTDATCVAPETGHLHAVFTNTLLGTADTEAGSVKKTGLADHVFGKPVYTWAGDECTAKRVCGNCPETETETATGTYVRDTDATCVAPETGHLHAVFTNTLFGTADTEAGSVKKTGLADHVFGKPVYTWAGDECTAKRVCGNCPETETETVTGTYVIDTKANCLEAETGHYEAEFKNEAFAKQSTDAGSVVTGDPLGHDYGEPSYSWNGNACTGMYVCARCADTVTETVKCGFVPDTEATCTEKTSGGYTAEFEDEMLETQYLENVEKGRPLGHDWGRWKQIREATVYVSGLKQRVCARCGAVEECWLPRVTWLADDEKAVPMTLTETDEGLTVEPERLAEDTLTLKMSAADIAQALPAENGTLTLKDGIEVVLEPELLQTAMQETGADTLLVTVEPVAAEEAGLPDGAAPVSGVRNVTVQLLCGEEAVEADIAEFAWIRVPEAFVSGDAALCLFGSDGEWQELTVEHAEEYLRIDFAGNGLYVLVK